MPGEVVADQFDPAGWERLGLAQDVRDARAAGLIRVDPQGRIFLRDVPADLRARMGQHRDFVHQILTARPRDADLTGPVTVEDPTRHHRAQFTVAILDAIATRVPRGTCVHDCFAGPGVRLGAFADRHGWIFTGTEIVAPFIVDERVVHGDATDPSTYPTEDHVVVTSPVYPNGMADDFKAQDPTKRNTYRAALHRILGHDEPLHVNNMGRYGYRPGRKVAEKKTNYWRLADATVACWTATRVFVNVKDFIHSVTADNPAGVVEPVVEPWAQLLARYGYTITDRIIVATKGQRFGANRHRVDHEVILEGSRAHPHRSRQPGGMI